MLRTGETMLNGLTVDRRMSANTGAMVIATLLTRVFWLTLQHTTSRTQSNRSDHILKCRHNPVHY